MKTTMEIKQHLQKAEEIMSSVSVAGEIVENLQSKNAEAVKVVQKNEMIKVPFVGDFSAGKSSLLNAFMGIDYLPTNLTPETAVAYEVYYDANEHLVIVHGDGKIENMESKEVKGLKLTPNDMVKVYINNPKIKELNERGIVLVDMPGIDSGIEAHNNAILKYIQDGTVFIIVADAEQGTLRNSALSFIRELKQYGLGASVLINKSDKKPSDDMQNNIYPHIKDQANRYIGDGTFVGITSASSGEIQDVAEALNRIDVEKTVKQRCMPVINGYISECAAAIQNRISIINTDKDKYADEVKRLKAGRDEAIEKLKTQDENVQSVEGSAQDILDDVRKALNNSSLNLANLLFSNGNDMNQFNAELVNIVRPVLINSFKREMTEYSNAIGEAVQGFAVEVNSILNDKNNKALDTAKELAGNIFGGLALENMIKAGIEKLMVRWAEKKGMVALLSVISKVVGPLVTILVNFIPDLLSIIFGKSKEEKIEEIRSKLTTMVFGKIVDNLRPEIENMLKQQRNDAKNSAAELINEEIRNFDIAIAQAEMEQTKNAEEREKETQTLVVAMQKLQELYIA